MILTPLEAALIGGAIATFTAVFTRVMSSRWYVTRKECDVFRSGCQLHTIAPVITCIQDDLKEIGRGQKTQQLLMRILMEKQGISLEEQLKIEKLAEGDIHE